MRRCSAGAADQERDCAVPASDERIDPMKPARVEPLTADMRERLHSARRINTVEKDLRTIADLMRGNWEALGFDVSVYAGESPMGGVEYFVLMSCLERYDCTAVHEVMLRDNADMVARIPSCMALQLTEAVLFGDETKKGSDR